MSQSKAPRVTIPVVKRKFDLFRVHVDYTSIAHTTKSVYGCWCARPYNIASRHARPGRGDDRAARDAVAPTSRRNPSRGLRRGLGAIVRSAQRDRSRARRAENSRGTVKKEARAILRASNARRVSKPSLHPRYTPAKPSKLRDSSRARTAPSRRFSTVSRLIDDEERSFFRSLARVFAGRECPSAPNPDHSGLSASRANVLASRANVLAKRMFPKSPTRADTHGSRLIGLPFISKHFSGIWALVGDCPFVGMAVRDSSTVLNFNVTTST